MRIIYGTNPVMEAIKGNPTGIDRVGILSGGTNKAVQDVIAAAREKGIPVVDMTAEEITRAAKTERHQGIAAFLFGEFMYRHVDDVIRAWKNGTGKALILILDSIQDPQNFGSLIRTAGAAGVNGIIIPKDRACEVTPVVVKASAGASEHVMIAREVNITRAIERLKEENIWVAAIEADGEGDIYNTDMDIDLAIVIGSEGKGIRRLVRESCDLCLNIPMTGRLNSLNAAQAGAIALFEARRQMKGGK